MGEKSKRKRQYIIEKAKEVFLEKGFKNVTMKDVVEKCEISRGGLYIYFASTEEIFNAVIAQDKSSVENFFEQVVTDATAAERLLLFLKDRKVEILNGNKELTQATYEFYFANQDAEDNVVKDRFDASVAIVGRLIAAGIENGEFHCQDPEGAARNIMYMVEGLKIAAQTKGLTSEEVDREFVYVLHSLGCEQD